MTPTRGYEALLILKTAGTEQDIARLASHMEEPIKKLGGQVEALERLLRLNEAIVRFMILNAEELPRPGAGAPRQAGSPQGAAVPVRA